MQILLAHSYFLRFDRKQLERARPYPPLATLQVASMLREAGHVIQVFDAMLADGIQDYWRQLRAMGPTLVVFYEDSFNYLSKMCLERMRQACCEMIGHASRAGARVLVVGPDATDSPETYLSAGADAVLLGEALQSLMTLTARLAVDPRIPVARWVEGDANAVTPTWGANAGPRARRAAEPRARMERPAWDLIDLQRYRTMWQGAHGYFSLNMAASRGCSFRCNWCAKPIWGNRYLQRDPDDVATEMAGLRQHFRPDHIWFADDIWGFRVDWINSFAQSIRAQGGAIPFTVQTRADLITEPMAVALRDAGCSEAWLGAESGSQRILDAMNKGTSVQELLQARARLRDHGIRVGFFIQLGYLGEELEDVVATRSLIERAVPDEIGVSVSYPLPGTPFYEKVKAQLGAKTHWQESSDLAMMFHGTYVSEFYWSVRELLHERVRIGRLAVEHAGTRDQALATLQQRWDDLIAQQDRFRRADRVTAPATCAAIV
ncbi:MAG TPA: radical SAM protein [Steroidobacteraceae bacterium]|nr:radical SAM protein [Steroidobacteraceae bacterium]